MKRKLLLSLFALLTATTAWADVEINETNFPDAIFRNWVLSQEYGADGKLTEDEIAGVNSISVKSMRIQSLKGIEYFTALTELLCSNNWLRALDVSKNTALTSLDCHYNWLTALDVSQNTALTWLECSNTQLTALDVSNNTALTSLECNRNQLTTLDVSQNTALTDLVCSDNQLTALNVSECTALGKLYCNNNQLTALDVSQNTALYSLGCSNNQLTALDVSKNIKLKVLGCDNNQLTDLNVSGCTVLTDLDCNNNRLTALDASGCAALGSLLCYSNQIKGEAMDVLVASLPTRDLKGYLRVIYNESEGNVMTTTQAAAAKDKGWKPQYYDGSMWQEYAGSEPVSQTSLVQDYFTMFLCDSTSTKNFNFTDVDSINFSNIGLDGLEYADYQVQEIHTADSIYRYPIAQIDRICFKEVNANQVVEDIIRADSYIAPLYRQCSTLEELSNYIPTLQNIDGIEDVYADHQTLFVKIRNYGTITYIYPPALKPGGILFNAHPSSSRRAAKGNEGHRHVNMGKALIWNQTIKDESEFFDEADEVYQEVKGMYDCMDITCDAKTDLGPKFFQNELFDYDHVFLITHGAYDKATNLHWLYTNEELLCVSDSCWINDKWALINFFLRYHTFTSNEVGIGAHREIRNGKLCVVYYTRISEKFIAASPKSFKNNGKVVVFNAACQSLTGNDNMAKAFNAKGAGCYLGYDETNDIGHLGGEFLFAGLLNAQSLGSAEQDIPEEYKSEIWSYNKTGKRDTVKLKKILSNTDADNICVFAPQTLDAETYQRSIILCGQVRMLLPSILNYCEVGFEFDVNAQMTSPEKKKAEPQFNEFSKILSFKSSVSYDNFWSNDIYYRAYFFDGHSYCYGDVESFTIHKLTCPDDNHPHAIDLGLPSGTKWCCCNVGASTPEDYGGYYGWDEDALYHVDTGSDIAGTSYDFATLNMGNPWRMPSVEQWEELINNCSRHGVVQNGAAGIFVTGRNGGQIFLPHAGYHWAGGLAYEGIGYYWSSTLKSYMCLGPYDYYIRRLNGYSSGYGSGYGLSVRAVCP